MATAVQGPEAEVLYCHAYEDALDAVTAKLADPPVLHTDALAGEADTAGD